MHVHGLRIIKGLKENNFIYGFETVHKVLKKNGKAPVAETEEGNLYELPETEVVAIGDKLLVTTIKDNKRVYSVKGIDYLTEKGSGGTGFLLFYSQKTEIFKNSV